MQKITKCYFLAQENEEEQRRRRRRKLQRKEKKKKRRGSEEQRQNFGGIQIYHEDRRDAEALAGEEDVNEREKEGQEKDEEEVRYYAHDVERIIFH